MSKAIAFLAGLGTGYFNAKGKKKDDERRDKRDARDDEIYEEGKADRADARAARQREQSDKDALRAAAAPVDVQTTAGQAMPAEAGNSAAVASNNPTTGGYRVGANTFADQGVAAADAAAQNTPEATRNRVTAAMMAQGNVLGADQLTTSGLQGKAARMAIGKGEREEANAVFDQGIKQALQTGGPQALAKFMSESQADGQGGNVKFQAVMAPDGKAWQMNRVGPDGALQPFGQSFAADEGGMATAGMMLSRSVPDDKKVAHLMQVKEAERKGKHDESTLAIQQQNADSTALNAKTNEQYRKDMAANMREQRRISEAHNKSIESGKAKAGEPIKVGLKDMRDFEGDLNGYIKDQYPVKDGADAKERASMNAQATAKKALGSALFQSNAAIGIPLTAGTVLQALELAQDRKNVRIVQVGDASHEAVIVNGQPVITTGPLQKKAPQVVAPAPNAAVPVAVNPVPSTPQVSPPLVNPNSPASMAARGQMVPNAGVGWKNIQP